MKSSEVKIAHAAIAALGAIANAEAARALADARSNASGEKLNRIAEARLQCAEALAAAGNKNDAMLIYLQLNAEPYPAPIRFAALRGQMKTEPENAEGRILALLKTQNAESQARAIRLVHEIPPAQNMNAIAQALPSLPALQQVQLLTALAARRDEAVRNAIAQATRSEEEAVRLAALKALAQVGDASSVLMLAEAASMKGSEGETARASLNGLRGENIDATIIAQLATSTAAIKVELIRSTEARRITAATSALLQAVRDDDEAVRLASIKALRTTAGAEHERALLDFLIQTKSEDERNELEKTVAVAAQKNPDTSARSAAILALLPNVKPIEAKASLLHVLGKIGESSALPELRAALQGKQPELRLAAIRALSDWPNATPQDNLLKIAQTSRDQTEKVLALRGFVRLLGSAPANATTLEHYQTAMQLAPNLEEKRMVLSGLSQQKDVAALRLATNYLGDPNLNAEATAAALKISETTSRTAPAQTKPVLQQVLKGDNEAWRTSAQNLLRAIERLEDFIMAWEVSGPYVGKDISLFEFEFPPEKGGGEWRKAEYAIDPQQPWLVPLDQMLGGESRVAYLRAKIWSDKAQPARLELGSDDGVRAWLNGELVHGNNASRGVNPGDDRVVITLKEGENVLLLKIIQGSGGWGACARVRGSAGEHLVDVRVVE
jgi:HEAT repeat protein